MRSPPVREWFHSLQYNVQLSQRTHADHSVSSLLNSVGVHLADFVADPGDWRRPRLHLPARPGQPALQGKRQPAGRAAPGATWWSSRRQLVAPVRRQTDGGESFSVRARHSWARALRTRLRWCWEAVGPTSVEVDAVTSTRDQHTLQDVSVLGHCYHRT